MDTFFLNVANQLTTSVLVAVVIAALIGVTIGFVYYRALGSAWREAADLTEEEAGQARSTGTYALAAVSYLLLALALYGVTWHASLGDVDFRALFIAASLSWLGFIAAPMAINHRFHRRPWSLTLIDAGHWLVVVMLQAFAIGLLL